MPSSSESAPTCLAFGEPIPAFAGCARADLAEIWDYSAERWGVDRSEVYIRDLQRAIERVAVDPAIGPACDDIRVGYRKLPSGSHVIFYREVDDAIEVIRILHQRMDLDDRL